MPGKSTDRLSAAHLLTVVVLAGIQIAMLMISILLNDWGYFVVTFIVMFGIWLSSRRGKTE